MEKLGQAENNSDSTSEAHVLENVLLRKLPTLWYFVMAAGTENYIHYLRVLFFVLQTGSQTVP